MLITGKQTKQCKRLVTKLHDRAKHFENIEAKLIYHASWLGQITLDSFSSDEKFKVCSILIISGEAERSGSKRVENARFKFLGGSPLMSKIVWH